MGNKALKIFLVGILTGALALIMWLSMSTALDLIGIWQKHEIDPDHVLKLGSWIAAAGGFTAPLLLYFIFNSIYGRRRKRQLQQQRAQQLKSILRPKRANPRPAAPGEAGTDKAAPAQTGTQKR